MTQPENYKKNTLASIYRKHTKNTFEQESNYNRGLVTGFKLVNNKRAKPSVYLKSQAHKSNSSVSRRKKCLSFENVGMKPTNHCKIPRKGRYNNITKFNQKQKLKKAQYFENMKVMHYKHFVESFNRDVKGTQVDMEDNESEEILLQHIFSSTRKIANTPSEYGKGFSRLGKLYNIPIETNTLNPGVKTSSNTLVATSLVNSPKTTIKDDSIQNLKSSKKNYKRLKKSLKRHNRPRTVTKTTNRRKERLDTIHENLEVTKKEEELHKKLKDIDIDTIKAFTGQSDGVKNGFSFKDSMRELDSLLTGKLQRKSLDFCDKNPPKSPKTPQNDAKNARKVTKISEFSPLISLKHQDIYSPHLRVEIERRVVDLSQNYRETNASSLKHCYPNLQLILDMYSPQIDGKTGTQKPENLRDFVLSNSKLRHKTKQEREGKQDLDSSKKSYHTHRVSKGNAFKAFSEKIKDLDHALSQKHGRKISPNPSHLGNIKSISNIQNQRSKLYHSKICSENPSMKSTSASLHWRSRPFSAINR
ncbi:unnamed protein product [Moneuplotes crassus]|uniref:Uncharacterized protein n=1 Tax=Euplotes crassus TaxID=5936 RepID=A0AAD1YB27_EUPCR|nr:unnamed protein product [Moneuplotes crassus]